MFSSSDVIAAAPDQVSCDIGSQMAILSLKNGIYYGLDAVGSRVWELVQTPRCFGDLQATLLAEYDVEPALLSRDLGRLCTSLAGAGLIEIRDAKGN